MSCVPALKVLCRKQYSPAHVREVYTMQDVPCRSECEIHAGNFCGDVDKGLRSDVKGCVILGKAFGQIEGQDAVLKSKQAVSEFEDEMAGEDFMLTIQWKDGINPDGL